MQPDINLNIRREKTWHTDGTLLHSILIQCYSKQLKKKKKKLKVLLLVLMLTFPIIIATITVSIVTIATFTLTIVTITVILARCVLCYLLCCTTGNCV